MNGHNDQALADVEQRAAHASCFTDEDKAIIHDVIRVYRGWLFIVKVIKGGTVVLGIIAGAILSISTIVEGVSWLPWK